MRDKGKDNAAADTLRMVLNSIHIHYIEYIMNERISNLYKDMLVNKLKTVVYPVQLISLSDFSVLAGKRDAMIDLRHNTLAKVPNAVIIALQEDKDYHGDYKQNSFAFYHYDIRSIRFELSQDLKRFNRTVFDYLDAQNIKTKKKMITQNIINSNIESLGYYKAVIDNNKGGYEFPLLNVNRFDDNKGLAVFSFTFDTQFVESDQTTPITPGPMRIYLTFQKALTKNIRVLVYTFQDAQFEYNLGSEKISWNFSTQQIAD